MSTSLSHVKNSVCSRLYEAKGIRVLVTVWIFLLSQPCGRSLKNILYIQIDVIIFNNDFAEYNKISKCRLFICN